MTASSRLGYWALVVPALALVAGLCFLPLLQVLWLSVSEPALGLQNYAELVDRPLLHRIWATTARICLTTTVITVLLGYLVAYAMTLVGPRQRAWMTFCVLLTFWLSVLVRSFAWIMLLRNEGVVNQALLGLGLVGQPLRLVRNEFGVVLGMVHVMLPFAVLPLYATMSRMDRRLMDAARAMGAGPARAFLLVFLPLSKPGIVSASILVFIFSLGFFITPALLGGGRVVMVAEYIRVSFEETLRWGLAAMLASALLLAVLGLLALVARVADLRQVFGAR